MFFLGSGSLTDKGQSAQTTQLNRGTSQERIFLLIGARSCGGTHRYQKSSKADNLNKDTPAGQVPGKLSMSVAFILLRTSPPHFLLPGAFLLPQASPPFGCFRERGPLAHTVLISPLNRGKPHHCSLPWWSLPLSPPAAEACFFQPKAQNWMDKIRQQQHEQRHQGWAVEIKLVQGMRESKAALPKQMS